MTDLHVPRDVDNVFELQASFVRLLENDVRHSGAVHCTDVVLLYNRKHHTTAECESNFSGKSQVKLLVATCKSNEVP